MKLRSTALLFFGSGLLALGLFTALVIPLFSPSLNYSPGMGYISMDVYGNFIASGTLFVLGVMFVVLAFWYNVDRGHGSRDLDM